MLMAIKDLLIERKQMTLMDLARHFYVSEDIMQGMLDHWQKKGRIEIIDTSGVCGTACGTCDESESSKIFFRWKEVAEKPISINSEQ